MLIPLIVTLLAQSPSTLDERAVVAAEKAADAAARAADAAQKSAEALQKLADLEAAEKAGAEAGAKPAEAAAPAPSPWSGGASLGFTWLAGNANSITFTAAGNIQRKSERWIFGAKAFGAYGQTTPNDAKLKPQTVALNGGALAQIDFRLIPMVSIIAAGGVDTDHVKSVELRGYGELGVGIMWVDTKVDDYQKLMLKTDVTFRVGSEGRYNYFPAAPACEGPLPGTKIDVAQPEGKDIDSNGNYTIDLPSCASAEGGGGSVLQIAPRAALAFRYALNKNIFFTDDFEIMPTVAGASAGRLVLNNTAKLNVRVVANFGISASWGLKFDSKPATGNKELDNAVIGALDLSF
jgi:putative salt-induced outer membrane protein YdiY